MAKHPLTVRIALVLKLYDVPADAFRVGRTRIFFKAGHIAQIRSILSQRLPISDSAAVAAAKGLLRLYEEALKEAELVSVRCSFVLAMVFFL